MLTSESTTNRSSHVVKDYVSGNLRTLTPVEAERIQMFPDNWTNIESKAMTERRRFFMMGNALVVGVVERLGDAIKEIVDGENWGDFMADKANTEERIKKAIELKESLETKLEKVKGTPREEEFKLQIDKINELITHLKKELD